MPEKKSFAELSQPVDGQTVRFCTTQSISCDLQLHGIDGVYRDDGFWSADMADHWELSEVTLWQGVGAVPQLDRRVVDVAGAQSLAKTIGRDWEAMTPEARAVFARELAQLSKSVLQMHGQAALRAEFEAWHLRRGRDRDYIGATDKGRAWLAVAELAGAAARALEGSPA